MTFIRVTKEFSFEMAHALWNYDGACSNIHGHTYLLAVTVLGKPVTDSGNPKLGMVIDFGILKKIIHDNVISIYDHTLLVSALANTGEIETAKQMFGRLKIVNFQPTCENILAEMAPVIQNALPPGLFLHSLKLRETPTSFAEWYASDNS